MIPEKSIQPKGMSQLHEVLKAEITEAQMSYKEYADRHRKPDPNWKQGDKVWLIPRNIRTTRPAKKLDYKKLGPFRILAKIGTKAYKLDLPDSMKIHPTFHVSLLETYQDNPLPSQVKPPAPPIEIDGNEEYELEEILDSRHRYKKLQYRAKWKGYTAEHDQEWYPAHNFNNAELAVQQFHERYPQKPGPQGQATQGRNGRTRPR